MGLSISSASATACRLIIVRSSRPSSIVDQAITALAFINAPNAKKGIRYIVAAATDIAPIASTINPDSGCKIGWSVNYQGIIS